MFSKLIHIAIHPLIPLSKGLFLCVVLLMVVQPILQFAVSSMDVDTEWCEALETEDSQEKELVDEKNGEKEHKLLCVHVLSKFRFIPINSPITQNKKYQDKHTCVTLFGPDVLLPPPERS